MKRDLSVVCLSECDKMAKWHFFMWRYIFLNQVFCIHDKFLCIHVKTIYSLPMRLASYQMLFFMSILYTKKDWWWARAWLPGSLGTDRRRNNMAGNNFFIHNAEEFFVSILSIFSQCTACLDVRDGDQAELISWRLEQYEETLRVMYQRITESCPDQGHRCDIEKLLNALRRILERLESLYCDNNEENGYEDIKTGSSAGISSSAYSGPVGRPSVTISVYYVLPYLYR